MSHADVKNVKITKSVLSLTKIDQIPAICSDNLCDFMRFFFCKSFIIGGIAPKSIGFLKDAVLWLNSWPIQKKLGIKVFFSISDKTEASRY